MRKALGVGVDLEVHHIAVTFDAGKTNLDHLLGVLAEAGYPSTSVS